MPVAVAFRELSALNGSGRSPPSPPLLAVVVAAAADVVVLEDDEEPARVERKLCPRVEVLKAMIW